MKQFLVTSDATFRDLEQRAGRHRVRANHVDAVPGHQAEIFRHSRGGPILAIRTLVPTERAVCHALQVELGGVLEEKLPLRHEPVSFRRHGGSHLNSPGPHPGVGNGRDVSDLSRTETAAPGSAPVAVSGK